MFSLVSAPNVRLMRQNQRDQFDFSRQECLSQTLWGRLNEKWVFAKGEGELGIHTGGLGNAKARATCKPAVSPSWNCLSRQGCLIFGSCLVLAIKMRVIVSD